MSKLTFNIVDIPDGQSRRVVELEAEDLDLSPYDFQGGSVDLEFYRTLHFIRVNFAVHTGVELVCDRSLKPFVLPVDDRFQVVFKVDVQEETEDEEGAVRRFNFSSNTLSIEDEVRDTIMLNIPLQKIHPDYLDEEGKPKKFETKSFGDVKEGKKSGEPVDPRWEKLKELKN